MNCPASRIHIATTPPIAQWNGPASAAEALPRVSSRKSRLVAVLELVAGLAVFGLGLQLDNTVLHGNADTIWLVLHGFALYGIGAGLYGLRP